MLQNGEGAWTVAAVPAQQRWTLTNVQPRRHLSFASSGKNAIPSFPLFTFSMQIILDLQRMILAFCLITITVIVLSLVTLTMSFSRFQKLILQFSEMLDCTIPLIFSRDSLPFDNLHPFLNSFRFSCI